MWPCLLQCNLKLVALRCVETAATVSFVIRLQAHMHICCVCSTYALLCVLLCIIAGDGCHVMIVHGSAYAESDALSMALLQNAVGPSYTTHSLMHMKHVSFCCFYELVFFGSLQTCQIYDLPLVCL